MKSTVETKVAAAIAASFVALTFGVVAQETSQGGTHQPDQKTMPWELSNAGRSGPDGSFSGRKGVQEASFEPSSSASQEIVAAEVAVSDR
jgi:hypothetical protein